MCKKILSVILALGLMLGLSAVSLAATAEDYGISVSGKKISLTSGGKASATYDMKSSDVKVRESDSGDLQVCFYDTSGAYKGINLKAQKSVAISGSPDSITILSSVSKDVTVTVPAGATVNTLTVQNSGKVSIYGKVTTLNVSGAANVSVHKGGVVSGGKVTSASAKITAYTGSSVKGIGKSSSTAAKKSDTTTRSGDYAVPSNKWNDTFDNNPDGISLRLEKDEDYIEANADDYLRDLYDELRANFTAYVNDRYDDDSNRMISGEFSWTESPSKTVVDGKVYSFKFYPHDTEYAPTSGSIRVVVR